MDFLKNLLTAIGGLSVLVVALAWLTRAIVSHVLDKDVESYKHRLEMLAKEHSVRFAALHEKRGTAIAQIYHLLEATLKEMRWFIRFLDKEVPEEQKLKNIEKLGDTFISFYGQNKIYFTKSLAERLSLIIEEMEQCVLFLSTLYDIPEQNLTDELRTELKKAIDKVLDDAELVKVNIEKEFRQLLGVEDGESDEEAPKITSPHRPWWAKAT